MNKQIPIMNKIISNIEMKRNWQLHQSRLQNAKPTLTTRLVNYQKLSKNVDSLNQTSRRVFGPSMNRMLEIQYENKSLLNKLTLKNKLITNTSRIIPTAKWNLNQNNPKLVKNHKKQYFINYQREKQNQGLLKRIKQAKPMYQVKKLIKDRKQTQQYINSIARFGLKGFKPNKTIMKFQITSNQVPNLTKYKQNLKDHMTSPNDYMISSKLSYQNSKLSGQSQIFSGQSPKLSRQISKLSNQNSKQSSSYHKSPSPLPIKKPLTQQSFRRCLMPNQSQLDQSRQHSISPQMVYIIQQRQIKINNKTFILKGKQFEDRISLQIIDCKKKQIGNDFIHQVEIQRRVYQRRFKARIDLLIQKLNFDTKQQAFFIN